jgi:hypothetical protein
MKSNPFYALSASAMLLGCCMLGEALELEAGKLGGLLLLIAVLQLYELLLVGLGAFLVRSGRAPRDGVVVLALASLFLMNATGLAAECVTTELRAGLLVALATAALGALKLAWVRRRAPDLLPRRTALALWLHSALVLALPVLAARLAAGRSFGPLALYGLWWLTAALPLARSALRTAGGGRAHAAPRAHRIWSFMPAALVLWQLWSVGYIHTVDFRMAFLTPLFLGLALASRPQQHRRKLALPIAAVLCALPAGPALAVPIPLADARVSGLRLALVAAALAWAWLASRDRDPWLMALPIGGASLWLLGPHAARLARAILVRLGDAVPRDRFGWGAVTVIAAFVLLAAGARRSLRGAPTGPRRPERAPAGAQGRP